ncbi:MAG: 5-formyltetrahydrofolate cyclo-ligase [Selenomonas sp.]|jgi:5-formyltetrahydrofolate cyclo-ligase|nr:5-formyltetrahydrofolate cyclo-ligase [Selenomonas sp.]
MMQDSAVGAAKQALRRKTTAARKALTAGYRQSASAKMLTMLYAQPAFETAQTIFLYASMADEVQLDALMERCLALGKMVCLPLITGPGTMEAAVLPSMAALVTGKFGIRTIDPACRQVLDARTIDLIIVPGAAFDAAGRRLGLGAGYYDRFMAERAPQASRIALTFDCQMVDEVPVEPHDQMVNLVITETKLLKVSD